MAVAAGIGLSRWLGIDDTITGLWIGGLIISLAIWTINWIIKKNIYFKGRKIIIALQDIDTNARLRALEEKILTCDLNNLNQILDLFYQPRVIA